MVSYGIIGFCLLTVGLGWLAYRKLKRTGLWSAQPTSEKGLELPEGAYLYRLSEPLTFAALPRYVDALRQGDKPTSRIVILQFDSLLSLSRSELTVLVGAIESLSKINVASIWTGSRIDFDGVVATLPDSFRGHLRYAADVEAAIRTCRAHLLGLRIAPGPDIGH